jgi:ferredoxin
MTKKLILCDCLGSQSIDANTITKATGLSCSKVYTFLCGAELENAAKEMTGSDVIIACQQERQQFEDLAEDIDAEVPGFVDLRDRAGWGAGPAGPKMAALAAEATLTAPATKTVDVVSEGTCLIMGGAAALQAAADLSDTLAVTVLLDASSDLPIDRSFDCVVGQLRQASGALGTFEVTIDQFQEMQPGGRGGFTLGPAKNGAKSGCDIILDLSGNPPLFSAHEKREGYLRADPSYQPAIAKAVFEAAQLVGTFEQPLFVQLEPSICAHSRAEQPACSNCLNVCPTGAITSAGEHVAIDPMICAGCGACSAVCPSGAITYDAPPVETIFRRINTLSTTYRKAGGNAPRLLVHDNSHGQELIALNARFGDGLSADVIPLEVDALAGFGHAEILGALACGFVDVSIMIGPKSDRDVIMAQVELAVAIAGLDQISVIEPQDPDALNATLQNAEQRTPCPNPIMPIGTRRQITRLAAKTLRPDETLLPLPANAPYGAVVVDDAACTLCLSCVSLCPSGALGDNPDKPQLRFQEDACLQCGLCSNICPENAITLQPQLDLTDMALSQKVLHEEEPFACIECGSLFGAKSTINKIMEKLVGNHAMFATSDAAKLIQMCENCRIQAQFHSADNPFQGGERPKTRTTEDYFSKRKDH